MKQFRYVILGDPHIGSDRDEIWSEVIDDINACRPDAVLVLGDLTGGVSTGTREGLGRAIEVLNQLESPWYSIIGNHDLQAEVFATDGDAVSAMLEGLGRNTPWFRQDLGPFSVLGLSNTRWRVNPVNKNEIVIDETQCEWWRSELKAIGDRPVLLLCHAPPIGSGLITMAELHARVGNAFVNQNHNPGGIQQIIWSHPNILFCFSGHNHLGQHYRDALTRKLGVFYAHTGTAGVAQARDGHRHSRVLDVNDCGFILRTFDHGLRRFDPALEHREARSLDELVALRQSFSGKKFVPSDPQTMHQDGGKYQRRAGIERFVFLSDAHVAGKLPDAQKRLLEWCRREILAMDPDHLILGGDMTHHASSEQAQSFLTRLALKQIPKVYLPGNNEGAGFTLPQADSHKLRLIQGCEGQDRNVYFLETPDQNHAREAAGQFLMRDPGDQPCLVFAHFPPGAIDESLEAKLASRAAPVTWVCGHRHYAETCRKGSLTLHICAGLDPVKVQRQLPEFLLIDWDGSSARVDRIEVPADVLLPSRPKVFPLGLIYQGPALDHLQTAIEHKAKAIQFHHNYVSGRPTQEELDWALRYREEVEGGFLSMHLPNFKDPASGLDAAFMEPWLIWAEAMGVDDFTIHLPKVPVSMVYASEGRFLDTDWVHQCVRAYTTLAKRALAMDAQLSLENLYLKTRCADEEETFSVRPWHIMSLIDRIRQELLAEGYPEVDAGRVGMILDSGHAFSDAKIPKIHGLADWMAQTGSYLQLGHIHQVEAGRGGNRNHFGITELLGPKINYHGFLDVLSDSVAKPFPLLIEVRDRDAALTSLEVLRQHPCAE